MVFFVVLYGLDVMICAQLIVLFTSEEYDVREEQTMVVISRQQGWNHFTFGSLAELLYGSISHLNHNEQSTLLSKPHAREKSFHQAAELSPFILDHVRRGINPYGCSTSLISSLSGRQDGTR